MLLNVAICTSFDVLQLGVSLVQQLAGDPLQESRSHLKHLLCCWSEYHLEAAKRLCSSEVAAKVLCSSADSEVKAVAQEACLRFQTLNLVSIAFVSAGH